MSGLRGPGGACAKGFTLMETLVMLVLVSLAALLMFQLLDGYRIAQLRVADQAGRLDRAALFEAWLGDSIQGLLAIPDRPFTGSRREFEGVTLNPVFGSPGAPTHVHWAITDAPGDDGVLVYAEAGRERWRMPMRDADQAAFAFVDASGAQHDRWPAALGTSDPLPSAVILLRVGDDGTAVRLAAVHGPLVPSNPPFQLEQE